MTFGYAFTFLHELLHDKNFLNGKYNVYDKELPEGVLGINEEQLNKLRKELTEKKIGNLSWGYILSHKYTIKEFGNKKYLIIPFSNSNEDEDELYIKIEIK